MTKKSLLAAGLICVLALSTLVWAESQQYTVTDLGTLPGRTGSFASGINNSGQVVGSSSSPSSYAHAFLWNDGVMRDLGTLSRFDPESIASGINDTGQVVGSSGTRQVYLTEFVTFYRAFLWSDGVMRDLVSLPGHLYSAYGINDAGQVVGWSYDAQCEKKICYQIPGRAFLWSDGVMSDLGTLPGHGQSVALGINASGQVVGTSGPPGYVSRAFLWSDGMMSDLGTLPGHYESGASGINASGQVVGWSYSGSPSYVSRAFLWSDGVMSDLGTLPGYTGSSASGINASGQVVGTSGHAFLWSDGVMTDLNDLIPPNSGWVLFSGAAINDAGQIVGYGTYNGQFTRAFLLTPTN